MPSAVTTHQSEDADAGGPLRRIFLLADLASEIHNHNKTKGRIVEFRHKIESLRSTVWQAEQTVTLLCQQLTSLDEQGVGKIRIEYDVSAFDPFYGSATENNIGRGASHVSPVQQQGQKRKMIHEEELEENGKRRKIATKSGPCYMVADASSLEGQRNLLISDSSCVLEWRRKLRRLANSLPFRGQSVRGQRY